jgi:hypothetical protein
MHETYTVLRLPRRHPAVYHVVRTPVNRLRRIIPER